MSTTDIIAIIAIIVSILGVALPPTIRFCIIPRRVRPVDIRVESPNLGEGSASRLTLTIDIYLNNRIGEMYCIEKISLIHENDEPVYAMHRTLHVANMSTIETVRGIILIPRETKSISVLFEVPKSIRGKNVIIEVSNNYNKIKSYTAFSVPKKYERIPTEIRH